MQLSTWLEEEEMTNVEFARRLGVAHTTVGRWISGEVFPRHGYLRQIEKLTCGRVTAADFLALDHEAA